jgi:RHS repeat-associated protein
VNVSYNGTSSTFVYDGDGMRVRKTENGETILYVNKYYEKNLTTGEETSYYYLGNRLVAKHSNTTLNYIHQDHLTGTALVTSDTGAQLGGTKYYPFGDRLESQGDLGTDKLFTGQRLDDTGLYYYGARYYDAGIGRFISADTIVPNPANPQAFNRYSYCLNNPLKYIDPSGHGEIGTMQIGDEKYTVMEENGQYYVVGEDGNLSGYYESEEALMEAAGGYYVQQFGDDDAFYAEIYFPDPTYTKYEIYKKTYFLWSSGELRYSESSSRFTWFQFEHPRYGEEGIWRRHIDWSLVAQKFATGKQNFANADWDRFGQAFGGSMQMTAGILGTEIFGGLALLGFAPAITGQAAQYFWGLTVDGLDSISGGQIRLDKMEGLFIPWP